MLLVTLASIIVKSRSLRAKINASLKMVISALIAYCVRTMSSHVSPHLQLINHSQSSRTDSARRAPLWPPRNRSQR